MFYEVVVLVNSEFESGRNPSFKFDSFQGVTRFMVTCFANGYSVEVSINDEGVVNG